MNTRRFGAVAELLVQKLVKHNTPTNLHHDLAGLHSDLRIEVKFSRAERKHKEPINEHNVISAIENDGLDVRLFASNDYLKNDWDCNIQQVKPDEFDILIYGICFADTVHLFLITPYDLLTDSRLGYCDKQHKGNVGEGQFHLNKRNFTTHLANYHFRSIGYSSMKMLLEHT